MKPEAVSGHRSWQWIDGARCEHATLCNVGRAVGAAITRVVIALVTRSLHFEVFRHEFLALDRIGRSMGEFTEATARVISICVIAAWAWLTQSTSDESCTSDGLHADL
jgi:hypothetical protein